MRGRFPSSPIPGMSADNVLNQYGFDAGCTCYRSEKLLVGIDARAGALKHNRASLFPLQYLCDRLPDIFHVDWLQSHLAVAEHRIDWEPLEKPNDDGEERIVQPKHDRRPDHNGISKAYSNCQFAFAALSDIEGWRAGVGTYPRNMNEPFDSGSLRLSRDPLSRFDVDGMKRVPSALDVEADCVHRAVSVGKRIGD
jgi:hypothetical protein